MKPEIDAERLARLRMLKEEVEVELACVQAGLSFDAPASVREAELVEELSRLTKRIPVLQVTLDSP